MFLFVLSMAITSYVMAGTIVDDFNRSTLGANWTADPEYVIDTNTMSNNSTTSSWGFLAVYNAIINPMEVSFRWAVGGDVEGANSGGVAIYLNSASVNATGYFVLRRYSKIDLHPIVNGIADRTTVLGTTSATQATPQPGDVIKVIPTTDASGHHFDLYVNGVFDGRVSDATKTYANVSNDLYSGVVLYGNRNNNIDDFTIKAPTITVTAPNGAELWLVNSAHNITWTSSDFSGNVKIEYSVDAGTSWSTIAASVTNSGSYTWTIPNAPSASTVVRVSDAADGFPSDVSNAVFEIVPETEDIQVVSPNGAENWIVNTNQTIQWNATSIIPFVAIDYSVDNGVSWTLIVASTANDGSYTWTVPAQITTQALVRVRDALDSLPTDVSNAVFSISALVSLEVPAASGQPGTGGNVVTVNMNNQTNIRGIFFRLTDLPDYLTVESVTPVGRASTFTVDSDETGGYLQVLLVSMSGAVIPTGSGPIVQISYQIDNAAPFGTTSGMNLSHVTLSNANSELVVPELVNGDFHYVLSGDMDADGDVDYSDADGGDIDRMLEIIMGTGAAVSDYEMLAGDLDNDGDIDLYDVLNVFDLI